jgi:plastocyanin
MAPLFPARATAFILGLMLLLPVTPAGTSAAETGDGGVIQGTVRITKKLTDQRMRFRLYPAHKSVLPPADQARRDDEYRNIVIHLESETPLAPAASTGPRQHSMAQEGETFIPHVLPIVVGSTVEFPNHDPIFHNVFSLSGPKTFDLGRYPQGDTKSVKFDRVGIIPVFCHIHSDMSAIIMVLGNPYFTVPTVDGHFRIENIPPGVHTLVAWHERTGPVETQIEIKDGQTLEINITVPIENDESSRP